MPDYQLFYDSWKTYLSDDKKLHEVSRAKAKKILDWISKSVPGDYSFDNLFGNKMRIIIPLKFKAENIGYFNDRDFRLIKDLKQLVDHSDIWNLDNDSLTRASVYKINAPKDFGPELNLKRYKSKTPPPPKRVEQKISKFLGNMAKSKRLIGPPVPGDTEGLIWRGIAKRMKEQWDQEADIKFSPQGSIIISRHPVDVARMSDFQNLVSCHTPGSSYYKCAVNESRGNAPVAYFIPKKQLDAFFKEKGTNEISDLDNEEILVDKDRNIEGLSPSTRIRLRKFTGDNNDSEYFELAVPEIRPYGNQVAHFAETVSDWALNNQLDQISKHEGNHKFLKDKKWRELFIKTRFRYAEAKAEGDEQEMEQAESEMLEIFDRIHAIMPDMSYGDIVWHGGSYKDTPTKDMFANWLGLHEKKWNQEEYKYYDAKMQNIFSQELVDEIANKYFNDDTFGNRDEKESRALDEMLRYLQIFYKKSNFENEEDNSQPHSFEPNELGMDELPDQPQPELEGPFYENPMYVEEMDHYNTLIDSLRERGNTYNNLEFILKNYLEIDNPIEWASEEMMRAIQADNIPFEMEIIAHFTFNFHLDHRDKVIKIREKLQDPTYKENLDEKINLRVSNLLGGWREWETDNNIKPSKFSISEVWHPSWDIHLVFYLDLRTDEDYYTRQGTDGRLRHAISMFHRYQEADMRFKSVKLEIQKILVEEGLVPTTDEELERQRLQDMIDSLITFPIGEGMQSKKKKSSLRIKLLKS